MAPLERPDEIAPVEVDMARSRPHSGTIVQVTTADETAQRIAKRAVEDELAVNEEGQVRLVIGFL